MIVSVSRRVVILSLILAWGWSGGLQLMAHSAVGAQSTFEVEQNQDLKQQAIQEPVHSQERDTLRRDYTGHISLRIYGCHVALHALYRSVTPKGQTANCASLRPLHQKISLYLI